MPFFHPNIGEEVVKGATLSPLFGRVDFVLHRLLLRLQLRLQLRDNLPLLRDRYIQLRLHDEKREQRGTNRDEHRQKNPEKCFYRHTSPYIGGYRAKLSA